MTRLTFSDFMLLCFVEILEGLKDMLLKPYHPGQFFTSRVMAVGLFDRSGGILRLPSDDTIELIIPEGALSEPTVLYMIVRCDKTEDCKITAFSPIIELGPDMQFEVSTDYN